MDEFESKVKSIRPRKLRPTNVYRLSVEEKSGVAAMGAQFPDRYERELAGPAPRSLIKHLIREKFSSRSVVPQRWNKGFPCFYTALEPDTAIREVGYAIRKHFGVPPETKERKSTYVHFSCRFSGRVTDIRPLAADYPALVADRHNDACHRVASLVYQSGVEGLLAPSVRNPDGNCLPVFRSNALKPGQILQRVVFVDRAEAEQPEVHIEALESPGAGDDTDGLV